jgi:putative transposase
MKRFAHPLLMLLTRATQKELVPMVEYLKAENRMLRSKLPKRIEVTPAERAKLLKREFGLGQRSRRSSASFILGHSLVGWAKASRGEDPASGDGHESRNRSASSSLRWPKPQGGATAEFWGSSRSFASTPSLARPSSGCHSIDNGFDPGPKRGYGSWAEFIQRHFKTVWATDFFTKTVWTMRGPVTYYVLFSSTCTLEECILPI